MPAPRDPFSASTSDQHGPWGRPAGTPTRSGLRPALLLTLRARLDTRVDRAGSPCVQTHGGVVPSGLSPGAGPCFPAFSGGSLLATPAAKVRGACGRPVDGGSR